MLPTIPEITITIGYFLDVVDILQLRLVSWYFNNVCCSKSVLRHLLACSYKSNSRHTLNKKKWLRNEEGVELTERRKEKLDRLTLPDLNRLIVFHYRKRRNMDLRMKLNRTMELARKPIPFINCSKRDFVRAKRPGSKLSMEEQLQILRHEWIQVSLEGWRQHLKELFEYIYIITPREKAHKIKHRCYQLTNCLKVMIANLKLNVLYHYCSTYLSNPCVYIAPYNRNLQMSVVSIVDSFLSEQVEVLKPLNSIQNCRWSTSNAPEPSTPSHMAGAIQFSTFPDPAAVHEHFQVFGELFSRESHWCRKILLGALISDLSDDMKFAFTSAFLNHFESYSSDDSTILYRLFTVKQVLPMQLYRRLIDHYRRNLGHATTVSLLSLIRNHSSTEDKNYWAFVEKILLGSA